MIASRMNRRVYDYRSAKLAFIWICVAVFCLIVIVSLYNQATQAASLAVNDLSEAIEAVPAAVPNIAVAPANDIPAPVTNLYPVADAPGCSTIPIQSLPQWVVCWGGATPRPELYLPVERERLKFWLDADTGTTYRF